MPTKQETPKPSWATQRAKRQETEQPVDPLAAQYRRDQLRAEREKYDADPQAYTENIRQHREWHYGLIQEWLRDELVLRAPAMQKVITDMAAASGRFEKPPSLIVHTTNKTMPWGKKPEFRVTVKFSDYIDTNTFSMKYFRAHPKQFRAAMAHELAHIANGDTTLERHVQMNISTPNQKTEVLAERAAAIIYGNPREYAKAQGELRDDVTRVPDHMYSGSYLSKNGNMRMLAKWADILEREGATNPDGTVIVEKAWPIFERSKDMAEAILNISPPRER